MPIGIGGAIMGAGILGDFMSMTSQQDTNLASENIAAANNREMEMLAGNAMTMRVADLKRAGLNPMLAVGGSGAVVPQMMMPSLQNPGAAFGAAGQQTAAGVSGAQAQAALPSQVAANLGNANQANALANKANVDAVKAAGVDTDLGRSTIATQATQQILNLANSDAANAGAMLSRAEVDVAHAKVGEIQANISYLMSAKDEKSASAALERLQGSMQQLNINQFKLIAPDLATTVAANAKSASSSAAIIDPQGKFAQSVMGKYSPYVDKILSWAGSIAGAALTGGAASVAVKGAIGSVAKPYQSTNIGFTQ